MIEAKEFKTLKEYQEANKLAHETLIGVEGYNSESYASEQGLLTVNDTYLLVLVTQFEKELSKVFDFNKFDEKIIKQGE